MPIWVCRMTRAAAAVLIFGALGCAGAGQATSFDQTWAEFERRCLMPFEAFAPPETADLMPHQTTDAAYWLPHAGGRLATLIVDPSPADGARACSVQGVGLTKGFDHWLTQATGSGRYVQVAANRWHSQDWIEPVIAVIRGDARVTVLETELEN